jgi:hypothetical protein
LMQIMSSWRCFMGQIRLRWSLIGLRMKLEVWMWFDLLLFELDYINNDIYLFINDFVLRCAVSV